jgi:hypothetical protein
MKPAPSGRTLDGNLTGRKIGLSLAEDAAEHLMGVLTDLYRNRVAAVLREYATNARDAHLEADLDRPIEVSLPTQLKPVLRIRDYGPGLDEDDLERIYTKYGASTKRDADIAAGMLGLGCKSALTYGDQFSVVTHKGGLAITCSITRNEKGSGELTIVNREPSARTGVDILVPVNPDDCQKFADEASYLFGFWPEGSVLVNDKAPERHADDESVVRIETDEADMYLIDQHVIGASYGDSGRVIQGGVPYPANYGTVHYGRGVILPRGKVIVRTVPVGTVDFTPSREELAETPRTSKLLEDTKALYELYLIASFQARVDAETDPTGLAEIAAEAEQFGVKGLQKDGAPIHKALYVSGGPVEANGQGAFVTIRAAEFKRAVLVEGFKAKALNTTHRARLRRHLVAEYDVPEDEVNRWLIALHHETVPTKNGVTPTDSAERTPFQVGGEPGAKRQFKHVIDWADVPRMKSVKTGQGDPSYEVFDPQGDPGLWSGSILASDLAAKSKVFVVHPHGEPRTSDWARYNPDYRERQRAHYLATTYPGCAVVKMARNRRDKFDRLVPQAEDAMLRIEKDARAWYEGLTDDEARFLARRSVQGRGSAEWWHVMDPDQVDDPLLKRAIRLERSYYERQSGEVKTRDGLKQQADAWGTLGVAQTLNPEDVERVDSSELAEKYPLVEWDHSYYRVDKQILAEHATLYVQAIFHKNNNERG